MHAAGGHEVVQKPKVVIKYKCRGGVDWVNPAACCTTASPIIPH